LGQFTRFSWAKSSIFFQNRKLKNGGFEKITFLDPPIFNSKKQDTFFFDFQPKIRFAHTYATHCIKPDLYTLF
jgi:hypothetical protein